jgi:hypothetical protein
LTIDIDATLITSHSEKENAAGNYKGGYGFFPLNAYADETREALAAMLRPGNAGSNTAADHTTVLDRALGQIPAEYIESLEVLVRADAAGATHGLLDYCREGNMRFSVGYELTEPVRQAILQLPDDAWVPALDQDGSERKNGQVAEITDRVDLSSWPECSRLIVRRERPHPGAQLSFTDHDGYRFQAILTDQDDQDIAIIECRHRQHAHVEDRIRDDKDTGLQKFPFKQFALNEVWLEIVMLAHDLIIWTQALLLDGELGKAEPKRLRYRVFHVAARLAFSGHARSSTCTTPGPGPPSSRQHSSGSKRSQPQPADTTHPPTHTTKQPPATGHDHGSPQTGKTRVSGSAEPPQTQPPPPTTPRSPPPTAGREAPEYLSRP